MIYEAVFHSDIKAAISQIVSYLSDKYSDVRTVAIDALKAFATDGQCFKMN